MVERRTSPVELLWDLVFVFAVTQVTTLLSHDLSWAGFGHGMLLLALVWWAWSAFVWAANAEQEESRVLRGILLVAMVFVFIAGLALPEAFGEEAVLFACCYAAVRLLHLALYAEASWTRQRVMVGDRRVRGDGGDRPGAPGRRRLRRTSQRARSSGPWRC